MKNSNWSPTIRVDISTKFTVNQKVLAREVVGYLAEHEIAKRLGITTEELNKLKEAAGGWSAELVKKLGITSEELRRLRREA